jgi:hypothetical protein
MFTGPIGVLPVNLSIAKLLPDTGDIWTVKPLDSIW